MRNMTVSLLNINQAQLTIDVLDKLARLPAGDWSIQLIVVDNGSRQDQVQLLIDWFLVNREQFAEVLFVAASRNLGVNGGRNMALKLASSDRILILDNDLILPDDSCWLDILWQRMEDDPKIGIVGPMLIFAAYPDIVQSTGIGLTKRGRVGYLDRAKSVNHILPHPKEVIASPAACWLLNKTAQQSVGLFSDEFYPMQYGDVDLCVRLRLAGWRIICDCSISIKHIENVTTRNLRDHPYAPGSRAAWDAI
jgi:GT2 family glycosyltransferase